PRRNLERKARCADLSVAASAVERLGARREAILEQTDVYFRVPKGRLKLRTLWLWHNVRIHLDEVAGLGTFVEFEAVMSASEDDATAHARLAELAASLALTPADDVAGSYADLLGL